MGSLRSLLGCTNTETEPREGWPRERQAWVQLSCLPDSHPELAPPQLLASAGRVAVRKEVQAAVGCELESSAEPCSGTVCPEPPAASAAAPDTLISKPVPLFPPPPKLPKDLRNPFDFFFLTFLHKTIWGTRGKAWPPSQSCLNQKNRPVSCQFHLVLGASPGRKEVQTWG